MSHLDAAFFESATDFRDWLVVNHATLNELWVGYWKKGAGQAGLTYAESVDEALCYGWIDGLTRSIDVQRYAIRFTPRRARSNWSQVNVARVAQLRAEGRLAPAGLSAFEARREPEPGAYTYETRPPDLPEPYASNFRQNAAAWTFFAAQRAAYRKSMTWWVVSAKREETRTRRLEALIAESAAGHVIDELKLPKLEQRRKSG